MKLLASLHLHEEDKADRFTELLAMHAIVDRALTALLSANVGDSRTLPPPEFTKLEMIMNRTPMKIRIDTARAAHLISKSCAKACDVVNNARNDLAHWRIKNSDDKLVLGHVEAISSEVAFERVMKRGERALKELIDKVIHALG